MKRKTFEKKIERIVYEAYFDDDAYLPNVVKRLIQATDSYHRSNCICDCNYYFGRHG